MLICIDKNCDCVHQELLNCLQTGKNNKARAIFQSQVHLVNSADTFGSNWLHYAAKCGNAEMVQYLVDEGFDVNTKNTFGITPLMLAVQSEDTATVEVLLQNKADVYLTNDHGISVFQFAACRRLFSPLVDCSRQECHRILEVLFDKVNNDFLTRKNETMQFLSSLNDTVKLAFVAIGGIDVAKFLLDNNYTANHKERDIKDFDWALILGKVENVALLIERGSDFTQTVHTFGFRYIKRIAHVDKEAMILKTWLKLVANKWPNLNEDDCNAVKYELVTLLRRGNKETVKALLESEIKVTTMTFISGRSFLHLLMENDRDNVLDLIDELNIVFDVNARNDNGITALILAAKTGSVRKIEFLVKHGANANFTTITFNDSALRCALDAYPSCPTVQERNEIVGQICELLLRHGADVQLIFRDGKSILDRFDLVYADATAARNVIAAHLALIDAIDQSKLTDRTRSSIESQPSFRTQFDVCAKQLLMMKACELNGAVTLFEVLITDNEEKLLTYARNSELGLAFKKTMESICNDLASYYINILQKMIKALDRVELERKVVSAMEALTKLCRVGHYAILHNIISYLSIEDMNNLCKV